MDFNEEQTRWKISERMDAMSYVEIDFDALDGKSVLDVGCAYGIWSVAAAAAGANVTSFDVREKWRDAHSMLCRDVGVTVPYIIHDIQNPVPEQYHADVVFFMAVLHHIPKWQTAFNNVFAAARETIYLDVAITRSKQCGGRGKNAGFLKRRKPWSWVPTMEKLEQHIESTKKWRIDHGRFGWRNGCDRVFLKLVKK